ncbi:MAG: hypothetical protein K2Q18_02005 [Bdellovibrionales bacterium]|nr:hypothetical protein [Bdellovibrionales bacterium]
MKTKVVIYFFFSLSIIVLLLVQTRAPVLAGTCDYYTGGCKGVQLENPGVPWGGTAATCKASVCNNKTSCLSVGPGAPYSCSYSF